MLRDEAAWVRAQLAQIPDHEVFPLLNIGCQTEWFRRVTQPWIDVEIFAPLRDRGGRVVHTDIQDQPGVDLVGDLFDPGFRDTVSELKPRAALCANVLEHVPDARGFAKAILQVLPPGGLLICTVPYKFPYHPDPIDSGFRPSPAELMRTFPGTAAVASEVVSGGTLARYAVDRAMARRNRPAQVTTTTPLGADRTKRSAQDVARSSVRLLPWIARPIAVSCVVLRVPPGPDEGSE